MCRRKYSARGVVNTVSCSNATHTAGKQAARVSVNLQPPQCILVTIVLLEVLAGPLGFCQLA